MFCATTTAQPLHYRIKDYSIQAISMPCSVLAFAAAKQKVSETSMSTLLTHIIHLVAPAGSPQIFRFPNYKRENAVGDGGQRKT